MATGAPHLGAGDEVVVVQHLRTSGAWADARSLTNAGSTSRSTSEPGRVQPPQRDGARRRARLVGGQQQVPPEALGVVVAAIERNPAGGDGVAGQPVGHERALAPSGRRDDQGQRQGRPQAQHVMQPFALYALLPEARPEQLGRDHDLGNASRHPPPPPLPQRQIPGRRRRGLAASAAWRDLGLWALCSR